MSSERPGRISASQRWTVLTWNIHGSAGPDVGSVASSIHAQAPDVVVLQEIRQRHAAELANALSMRYSWALKHQPYTKLMWWRAEGMAIMTPHRLDAVGHTEISDGQPMRSWRRRIAQWGLVGRADRMSNPSEAPTQALDHVLLPSHAHDVEVSAPAGGTHWAAISDHLPVTVRFTLRDGYFFFLASAGGALSTPLASASSR